MKKRQLYTPKERSDRIAQSMFRLIGNDAFQTFIDELREQQRAAMLDSVNDAVVGNDRKSLVAAGEIRAYEAIIGMYDDFIAQQVQQGEIENEARAS
jgi:hypothetical protein